MPRQSTNTRSRSTNKPLRSVICRFISVKNLSAELKLYQERLNIYTDETAQETEGTSDPILIKLGLRQGELNLVKKDYNYLVPLLVAYKNKIAHLDSHVGQGRLLVAHGAIQSICPHDKRVAQAN